MALLSLCRHQKYIISKGENKNMQNNSLFYVASYGHNGSSLNGICNLLTTYYRHRTLYFPLSCLSAFMHMGTNEFLKNRIILALHSVVLLMVVIVIVILATSGRGVALVPAVHASLVFIVL